MLKFYSDHKAVFPVLWIQSQCEESRRVVEVGCERFFNLAGYISSPRRTNLGVRTYERLAMLSCLLRKVYVDEEWVAQEYLRRCKAGAWKSEQDEESLKCWNLERIIESELIGAPVPVDLTMEEFVEVDASIQVPNFYFSWLLQTSNSPTSTPEVGFFLSLRKDLSPNPSPIHARPHAIKQSRVQWWLAKALNREKAQNWQTLLPNIGMEEGLTQRRSREGRTGHLHGGITITITSNERQASGSEPPSTMHMPALAALGLPTPELALMDGLPWWQSGGPMMAPMAGTYSSPIHPLSMKCCGRRAIQMALRLALSIKRADATANLLIIK
ncbi:hypothetical protein THAOC_08255 [Thalassiosira oceanica]|uniref:Uncharacterized protein n=1 Tax=Thalassiosira oceanica TaxID=159749 RepID=K0TIL4_THAOC|nr:hypothetical protein THAOC_08255 [Thalassiosira oceanica]|eukprot:EJK70392.1 hypothetical protein THAOC_08255 [Thalassiosira oceanica]